MKLVTVEYLEANKHPYIVLFTREGKIRQKIVVNDFRPYFYIPLDELPKSSGSVEKYKTLTGETVAKYYVQTPGDVTHMRRMFSRTWEADVHFTTRYLIDKVDKFEPVNLRVHYADIEKDQETDQIISIATYDNYLDKVVCFAWHPNIKPEVKQTTYTFPKTGYKFHASLHLYNNRLVMLRDYLRFVKDTNPDIMTGWYFIKYDMKEIIKELESTKGLSPSWLSPLGKAYIRKEHRYYEEDVVVKGRVLWDMLKAYDNLQPTGLPDSSLEAIAQKELGEGKYPLEQPISQVWRENFPVLVEYNCKDAVLVYRIDKKCKILDYYDSLRRWVGCEWGNLYSPTQMWDTYILRKVHNKLVLPTKKRLEIERIKGAEVFEPSSKGIHHWVVLLDLKSLYPSIIMTFNMSPETIVKNNSVNTELTGKYRIYQLKNGVSFLSQPIGLLPSILMELKEEREKYKAEMKKYPFGTTEYDVYDHLQTGVKVMMNALYGATVYKNFRLATREIGSSVTFMGRTVINWVRQKVESLGYKVLYGDTDSVFCLSQKDNLQEIIQEMNQLVNTLNKGLKDVVSASYGNKNNCYIKIEPKKIYKTFLIAKRKGGDKAAKKRYAGRVVWVDGKKVDKLDIMGFEARRSNSSQLSRDLQKKILRVLFEYEPQKKLKVYIKEAKEKLASDDYDYIGIPQGLTRRLISYKTDNPWVRGAKYANEYFGENFGTGDKPKLIYVSRSPSGYPRTDVICFRRGKDLPKGFVIDVPKMFQKSVVMKLEQILESANLSIEEIVYGQSRLDQF